MMAIAWIGDERSRVEQVLARYPVASGRCESAAWEILPIGRERDPQAQLWQLLPTEGRYVVPRVDQDPSGATISPSRLRPTVSTL